MASWVSGEEKYNHKTWSKVIKVLSLSLWANTLKGGHIKSVIEADTINILILTVDHMITRMCHRELWPSSHQLSRASDVVVSAGQDNGAFSGYRDRYFPQEFRSEESDFCALSALFFWPALDEIISFPVRGGEKSCQLYTDTLMVRREAWRRKQRSKVTVKSTVKTTHRDPAYNILCIDYFGF